MPCTRNSCITPAAPCSGSKACCLPGDLDPSAAVKLVSEAADNLVRLAESLGVVVRIDLKPNVPLAMRNYSMVPDVRPKILRD